MTRRDFRDRDFIETPAGLFCVIGSTHPPDRVIAYLKYVHTRDPQLWKRGETYFDRIMRVYSASMYLDVLSYLKEKYPHYVVYDEYLSLELIEVPRKEILRHYKPEERAKEILENPVDPLEQEAKMLLEDILSYANISLDYVGVTGSILLKIHNTEKSDIDLIFYGKETVKIVQETVEKLQRSNVLSRPSWLLEETINNASRAHSHLDRGVIAKLIYRKIHRFVYRGKRPISILFALKENEVREPYGRFRYRTLVPVLAKARVVSVEYSYFMPAIYDVEIIRMLEPDNLNVKLKDIRNVSSFEGLYAGIARENEIVVVKGMLEEVMDVKTGESWYRIVVGSAKLRGKDYVIPESLL